MVFPLLIFFTCRRSTLLLYWYSTQADAYEATLISSPNPEGHIGSAETFAPFEVTEVWTCTT